MSTATEDTPGVKARIDALNERVRTAEALAAQATTLQAQLADAHAARVKAEQNAAFATYGVATPSARRGLTRDYTDYAKDAGDKAIPFDQWLNSEGRADPLYAAHFRFDANGQPIAPPKVETPAVVEPVVTPATVVAPAATPATPAPGNPNGGAVVQPPVTGKVFDDDAVRNMSQSAWASNAPIVKQQLEQGVGGIRVILPKPRVKA